MLGSHENPIRGQDKPALPALALREALINAVVHRDYSYGTTSIYLAIYSDRLELWNDAVLSQKIEINKLKELHHSYRHNKIIADVFYKRGFIEAWGSGINKMVTLCKIDGLPEPEFQGKFGTFGVIFKFKAPITTSIVSEVNSKLQLSTRQKNILAIIKTTGVANIKQIMSELKNQIPQRTIQYDLAKLKSFGLIKNEGKGKSLLWSISKK